MGHVKFERRESKHTRDQTPLMELSTRRNWAVGVMIGGMIGGLKYLKRSWPSIDIHRAIQALQSIEEQIETQWWNAREEMREQITRDLEETAKIVERLDNERRRENERTEHVRREWQ